MARDCFTQMFGFGRCSLVGRLTRFLRFGLEDSHPGLVFVPVFEAEPFVKLSRFQVGFIKFQHEGFDSASPAKGTARIEGEASQSFASMLLQNEELVKPRDASAEFQTIAEGYRHIAHSLVIGLYDPCLPVFGSGYESAEGGYGPLHIQVDDAKMAIEL